MIFITYFARPIGLETPIKIGRTITPSGRLLDLRWHGCRCEYLALIDGNFEFRFHAKFADWHEGGEWFTATPALLETIDAINAFAFDLSTLPPKRELSGGRYHKAKIGALAKIGIAA
jgi:hypothetical protein